MTDNLYAPFVEKMINHFGTDGLIIYSRSNDFYENCPITIEDVKMYYDYLLKKNSQLPNHVFRQNQIACCLYYLSKIDPENKRVFNKTIIANLQMNDPVDDRNMFLIFNAIEFDDAFLNSKHDKLNFLYSYLHKFMSLHKKFEDFLLYKYYNGLLAYHLGDYNMAFTEFNQIILSICDEGGAKNNYVRYIEIRNSFLNLKVSKAQKTTDIHELSIAFKDSFNQMKSLNPSLAVKLGLGIYELYLNQNKYDECKAILKEIEDVFDKALLSGNGLNEGIDFYLAVSSRQAYVGTLLCDKELLTKSMDKLKMSISHITTNKEQKFQYLTHAYDFLLAILKKNNSLPLDYPQKLASSFKSDFVDTKNNQSKCKHIVDDSNRNECYINIFAMNNMDYEMGNITFDFIKKCSSLLNENKKLPKNQILPFICAMYNVIARLSSSMLTEKNSNQINSHKQTIESYANKIILFLETHSAEEAILKTPFAKMIVVKSFVAYLGMLTQDKKLERLEVAIKKLEEISKNLNINKSDIGFGMLMKIKADFFYHKKLYDNAKKFYIIALDLMDYNDPKKPTVFFNLGCTYYYLKETKNCEENLMKSINGFNQLRERNMTDIQRKMNDEKVQIAEAILKKFT